MKLSSIRRACALLAVAITSVDRAAAQLSGHPLPLPYTTAGGDQYDLAHGDLDGDGRDELVIASATDSVHVLWLDGSARVQAKTILATGWSMQAVAVGDVDGDGRADVVGVEWGDGGTGDRGIHVWLGDGAGGFAALAEQAGGNGDPWEIALGDATGDGALDLFWGGTSVFEGDGAGGFTLISTYAYFGNGNGIGLGDFDEDGRMDVAGGASTSFPSAWVSLSNGDGTFTTSAQPGFGGPCRDIDVLDVDGDGDLDLVGAVDHWLNQLSVTLGNGDGTFQAPQLFKLALEPDEVEAADLDGDGALEIVCIDLGNSLVHVLEYAGSAVRVVATVGSPQYGARPVLADLDGDGDLDFAAINKHEDGVYVAPQIGPRVFETTQVFGVSGALFGALACGDLDGDGLDEILATDADGTGPSVVRPQPGGGFIAPKTYVSSGGPRAIELADLDEDGDLDAVIAHDATQCLGVMLGDGAGELGGAALVATVGLAVDVALGDWNGDRHVDAAVALQSPSGFALYLGDGTGALVLHATVATAGVPTSIEAGDLDLDGALDVAVAGDAAVAVTAYSGDGAGGFATGVVLPAAPGAVLRIAAGDLDGDGATDLAISHQGSPALEVLFADGGGAFTPASFTGFAGSGGALAVRDVDLDGDDDVFLANTTQRSFWLLRGDPARTLTEGGAWLAAGGASALASGRFDGDALADAAFCAGTWISAARTASQPSGTTLYCIPKTNSKFCVPGLGWSGEPSLGAASGFTISAHEVLSQKVGLFFYGVSGPNQVAFLGGTYCVKPPTKRTALQSSGGNPPPIDCSGVYALDFNAYMAGSSDPNLTAGTTVWGQFWSRDPGFAAPNNVGFTGGIRFVVLP